MSGLTTMAGANARKMLRSYGQYLADLDLGVTGIGMRFLVAVDCIADVREPLDPFEFTEKRLRVCRQTGEFIGLATEAIDYLRQHGAPILDLEIASAESRLMLDGRASLTDEVRELVHRQAQERPSGDRIGGY